jgi:hypothetical protein
MAVVQRTFSQWRYWLVAALLLLAGAVGGVAAAKEPAANSATSCRNGDHGGCAAILTSASQPSILQALARLDGKALNHADGPAAGIAPQGWDLSAISGTAHRAEWPETHAHRRRLEGGAQPRAPPLKA